MVFYLFVHVSVFVELAVFIFLWAKKSSPDVLMKMAIRVSLHGYYY